MSTASGERIVAICCSVFRAEVEELRRKNWPNLAVQYLSSTLHMEPGKLATRLAKVVELEISQGTKVILIYGDCCMGMAELACLPGVVRTQGKNCCDLLLGNTEYKRLSHDGVFFLFPEWASRWRHIFNVELGLDQINTADLMGDMHCKLVYLDTGVVPIPLDDLQECANYCKLTLEVLPVSLETLRSAIQDALDILKSYKS